ncbi:MAG: hypothetical protein AB1921_03090 [Thermodesulfobacteriota bacterium]
MEAIIKKTSDVFGITRDIPLNYTTRESADAALIDNLTRDKHIVIYGSSKQGKTCLRKHSLDDNDYITIHCSNKYGIGDLNASILKMAGYQTEQSSTKTVSGKNKIVAKIKIGLLGAQAAGGGEAQNETTNAITSAPLELDPDDVNDIIMALRKINFSKYIVLEDFHYLPIETQKDFAVALKAFHEASSLCFIIIGVWLEENRLTVYNGDLTGRLIAIDADKWSKIELKQVIMTGETLLNIKFSDQFRDELLANCFDSVHIVQEACYRCCISGGIHSTRRQMETIGIEIHAKDVIRDIVNQNTGRYHSFLAQFADGFQDTSLQMYKWLLYPVITSETSELTKGLRWSYMRSKLRDHHPEGASLNPGNITQSLQASAALQVKKEIKPIILDYDQTNQRLRVVDRSFLIWLDHQNRNDILSLIDLPID